MSSPRERLEALIAARIPSEVVFRLTKVQHDDSLAFESVIVKEHSWRGDDSDTELKLALLDEIEETWDGIAGKYHVNASVEKLWSKIKNTILREYDKNSPRCKATMRKTENFIRDIQIDDKHLPNYLLTVFLVVSSSPYENKSRLECEALFEQFESLRRTYGKRNR